MTKLADGRPGTMVVELFGIDQPPRQVARVPAFGRLADETWEPMLGLPFVVSDLGYLATAMQRLDKEAPSEIWVVDLRQPARPIARLRGGENGFGWGPKGRLAVIGPDSGTAVIADVPAGTTATIGAKPGIALWPYAAADGSGWYGGPVNGPPSGIVGLDGAFRAGPLPPSNPGLARFWSADGEEVGAEPDDGARRRRVFTVARDGTVRNWYRFAIPDGRAFGNGEVRWSADRTGLWVLDQVARAYRIVLLASPGAAPRVAVRIPYTGGPTEEITTALAGLSADDSMAVIQRFHEEQPALTLVNLRTNAILDISRPDAVTVEFAGWAAWP